MKKLLSLLLCFALLMSIAPTVSATVRTEGNFAYVIEKNGEATLTGIVNPTDEINIPETLDGHTVTRVAKGAISGLSAKRIIVPKTVRYFEENSILNCMSASVYILGENPVYEECAVMCVYRVYAYRNETSPAGVVITDFCPMDEYPSEPWLLEEITEGEVTYAICDGEAIVLGVVTMRDNYVLPQTLGGCPVTHIAPYAFESAAVNAITLGEGIRSIGAHAIEKPNITVNLPSTLEHIGDYAFYKTRTTDLPTSIKHIGAYAFYQSSIMQVTFGEQLEYIGEFAFFENPISQVTIPASTKYIGKTAFGAMNFSEGLVATVLSRDVICDSALGVCTKIIGYMGSTAMYEAIRCGACFVDFETGETIPAAYYTQQNNLLYYVYYDRAEVAGVCDTTVEYDLFTIDETVDGRPVTCINNLALSDLNASSVIMPNTITAIADYAFYDNAALQEIMISENIEFLGENSFGGCRSLRLIFWLNNAHEITLSNASLSCGDILFYDRDDTYFVTIPNSKVQAFAEREGYRFLPLTEDMAYITDGLGVYSTDGEEATLIAMYQKIYETEPTTFVLPDTIYGIPITTISSDVYWSDRMTKLVLGYYVTTVENGALANSDLKELVANKDVKSLPYPLFAKDVEGIVYGYGDSYAERFCKEHGYTFRQIDSLPFNDVKKSDWYFNSVLFCYSMGLMNGTSETSFAPNATTTRAMLTQVLYNMSGTPGCSWEYGFKDVKTSDWFCEAVNWCKYYGLANGTSEFYFSPKQNVTREQVATFLYRYAQACQIPVTSNGDLSPFNDKNRVSSYAAEAMRWAVEYGIMNGQSATKLNPHGYATRAEIATMLMRFIDYAEEYILQNDAA